MKTRFELVLTGPDLSQLRAAGDEALDEIQRVERALNLYDNASEIAQINARAALEPVRVSPEVFALLEQAREYNRLSGRTFDPTIAPLVRCWGFMKGSGARPEEDAIAAAKNLVGFDAIELDPHACTVHFQKPGMMLDLGSIGKGYALDCAAQFLRDAGIQNALLHGGTSTIVALGAEPGRSGWRVAIEAPPTHTEPETISVVELSDQSLSVSAVWGKYFINDGKTYGHVIDPRTGWPAGNASLAAVVLSTATATDAISTAVLLGTPRELAELEQRFPDIRYLQLTSGTPPQVIAHRMSVDKSLDTPAPPSV